MKFSINLSGKTLYSFMRECGYSPQNEPRTRSFGTVRGELAFHRFLTGRFYPKFHAYCALAADKKTAAINLHLDQKKPSYKGAHAHNAEHSGPVVEAEAERIQEKARPKV